MGPEELKAIVEMIGGLGASTMYGFIAYLVFQTLFTLISYGVGVFGIIIGYKLGRHIIETVQGESAAVNLLKKLRDRWNIGAGGYIANNEFIQIEKKISELEKQAGKEE